MAATTMIITGQTALTLREGLAATGYFVEVKSPIGVRWGQKKYGDFIPKNYGSPPFGAEFNTSYELKGTDGSIVSRVVRILRTHKREFDVRENTKSVHVCCKGSVSQVSNVVKEIKAAL